MSLFNEVIKIQARRNHSGFYDSKYGQYSKINDIDKNIYSPLELKKIQIELIQKASANNIRLKEANNFINNLPKYKISETETLCANEVFSKIANILNSPFKSGSQEIRIMSNKAEELEKMLKLINVKMPIPEKVKSVLNTSDILIKDQNFYSYKAEKAALFENLVAKYIEGLNNGSSAIVTGNWGKISDNNRQLLTDVFIFLDDKKDKKLKGSYVTYEKSGYYLEDNKRAYSAINMSVQGQSLKSFTEVLNSINGNASIGFSINDELSDCLDTISSLKTQVKSGINQSILNNSFRNSITLQEIKLDNKLDLLFDLYKLDENQGFKFFYKNAKSSETLTQYGDYLLSKSIAKISLLSDNDIYFTEKGFETIYDWMNRKNFYLKLQQKIRINNILLTQRRKYNFNYAK